MSNRNLIRLFVCVLWAFIVPRAFACTGSDCAAGLAYEAFGVEQKAAHPTLAVFVHGAVSKGGPADYMYGHARQFAASHRNVVAVALLAPGYYDAAGKQSDGSDAGRRLSDDTGPLSGAIRELKARYGAGRVIALGHSKGAMNLGGVIGRNPGLIQGVVLVAGIFDLPALSISRGKPQSGVSGGDYVSSISKSTTIIAVAGSADTDVPISQSLDFIEKAQKAGLNAQMMTVPNVAHDFKGALSDTAIGALGRLAR